VKFPSLQQWPIHVGQTAAIDVHMTGDGTLDFEMFGPNDSSPDPVLLTPFDDPGWHRPGDAWNGAIAFPATGCWDLYALCQESSRKWYGDVWINIDPEHNSSAWSPAHHAGLAMRPSSS
jgi:hypothetical protein